MIYDLAIVGGGLSGLALARHAQNTGLSYQLLEARDRFGGRIERLNGGGAFDLGPSWFWPEHTRMATLASDLGLHVFEQYSDGDALYDDGTSVQRARGAASMAGTFRIDGGVQAMIDALVAGLPQDALHLNSAVTALICEDHATIQIADRRITARQVVLATPPRIAASLTNLPPDASETPGWMAGQAKLIATYPNPFWRDAGLSGDAVSRVGPMVEMHDATDPATGVGAIFGFVGIPAPHRDGQAEAIRQAGLTQLIRLFGPQAANPTQLVLKDWAQEQFTATRPDWDFNGPHPRYGCPPALRDLWDGKLLLGSTEMAATQGGFLEGALERAEEVAVLLG